MSTGTLTGTVFEDLDGNGARGVGEPPLSGWTVYLDQNFNSTLDPGEPTSVSNSSGNYSFTVNGDSFYIVREVLQSGYQQNAPSAGSYAVFVSSGQTVAELDFGNQVIVPGTISGAVFRDVNQNGTRDASEPGLGGWTVYLDINFSGGLDPGEPSAVSAANGTYSIAATPGFYQVREVLKPNYVQTTPIGGSLFANLQPGRSVTGQLFGNYIDVVPATISGQVFEDANGNGVRDGGESALSGWTVYLDTNNNSVLDSGEPNLASNASGDYSFSVDAGTYNVRAVAQAGYTQTAPVGGVYNLTVTDGQVVSGRNFGFRQSVVSASSISGTVFDDQNNNGAREAGEPGLVGWSVFLDNNLNGSPDSGEPLALTDSTGFYSFNVDPGTYVVREIVQAGYIQTTPVDLAYFVTVTPGSSAPNRNFGNYRPSAGGKGTVAGTVYRDENGNGAQDLGDAPLLNWTVYLDLNNNGAQNLGEPSANTDASGAYRFVVDPGTYVVREVLQAGFTQTQPATGFYSVTLAAGDVADRRDFGNRPIGGGMSTISGRVFLDGNGNANRETNEQGLAGWNLYLDLNFNGLLDGTEPRTTSAADGTYVFAVLPGFYMVREVVQPGFSQTSPSGGIGFANVPTGGSVTGLDFGNQSSSLSARISGVVYDDANGNGVRDPGESGLFDWTVYLDANNNGTRDPGETWMISGPDGSYSFTVLAGTYNVRQMIQATYTQTQPSTPSYVITVAALDDASGRDFGNARSSANPATISGSVFNDVNANGVRDGAESGLAGWTVYLDANNNGSLDPGETSLATNASGDYSFSVSAGTYRVREVLQAGFTQTAPVGGVHVVTVAGGGVADNRNFGNVATVSLATISGTVYDDLNGSAARDPGEPALAGWTVYIDSNNSGSLDAGEPTTVSNASGGYSFSVLAGQYRIREVVQPGYVQTAPLGFVHSVLVNAGDVVTGRDFGNRLAPTTGTLTGVVFNDQNKNGLRDSGEPGLAGWTVFLDLNFSNSLDAGEPNALSAADGSYSIQAAPGFYVVREILKTNWALTTPIGNQYFVSVTSGGTVGGLNFGNFSLRPEATLAGAVFEDLDGNGIRDVGEGPLSGWTVYLDLNNNRSLDAGEPSQVTPASGDYRFTVDPGSYVIRQVVAAGYQQTTPLTNDGSYPVTVANGDVASGRDFGNRLIPTTGRVSGVVYRDNNGNGVRDAGEPGLSGWTVYGDANFNGTIDPGEVVTTSALDGSYALTLLPGFYAIREVIQTGFTLSEPSFGFYFENLAVGDLKAGRNFGNRPLAGGNGGPFRPESVGDAPIPGALAASQVYLGEPTNMDGFIPPPVVETPAAPTLQPASSETPEESEAIDLRARASARIRLLISRDTIDEFTSLLLD